jgi:serine protease
VRARSSPVRRAIGTGWQLRPFGDAGVDFEVINPRARLSTGEAWELSYRLRAIPGVIYAEPLFVMPTSHDPATAAADVAPAVPRGAVRAESSGGGDQHVPESNDPEWNVKMLHVDAAWATHFPGVERPAEGIVVGHPDTGSTVHPEIVSILHLADGYDFLKGDSDPTDELERPPDVLIPNPGHGTSTGSVIASLRGTQASYPSGNGVSGIAPGARLVPFRVTHTVVLLSFVALSRAIERAADRGAHVISMSLGGLFGSSRLRKAIAYAHRRGVIVLAAAGNRAPFVVWPAAYDEVIAVAACNARRDVWRGSSRGGAVDVTAPGESVWRAVVENKRDGLSFDVLRGSGTSFAVASVAGVAALWLAKHGRGALVQRYGKEKLPFIFNRLLRATCDPMPAWPKGKFGTGLVNAKRLLDTPLPNPGLETLAAPAFDLQGHAPVDRGDVVTFEHLFGSESGQASRLEAVSREATQRVAVETALAALLGVPAADPVLHVRLREVGQELAFMLATRPALYEQFRSALAVTPMALERSPEATTANLGVMRAAIARESASPALFRAMRA